mmetsp:Transcript_118845/g.282009  ORF Transcript_118845/g.282009 Transcript_118845/m.282009 type:complete len:256 (+) Transcript_118845:270-1037(+)
MVAMDARLTELGLSLISTGAGASCTFPQRHTLQPCGHGLPHFVQKPLTMEVAVLPLMVTWSAGTSKTGTSPLQAFGLTSLSLTRITGASSSQEAFKGGSCPNCEVRELPTEFGVRVIALMSTVATDLFDGVPSPALMGTYLVCSWPPGVGGGSVGASKEPPSTSGGPPEMAETSVPVQSSFWTFFTISCTSTTLGMCFVTSWTWISGCSTILSCTWTQGTSMILSRVSITGFFTCRTISWICTLGTSTTFSMVWM